MPNKAFYRGVVHSLDNAGLNREQWLDAAVNLMNTHADDGDHQLGQLRKELNAAGPGTDAYRVGVSKYIGEMARSGNHFVALRTASQTAGLLPPPTDDGPFDRLVDRSRPRRARSGHSSLRDAWKKLNEPRR